MPNKTTYIIAFLILIAAFSLCFFSLLNDCWTFDETAHIGAGYSYLTQQDYRLNPEHPPLIKDLAAIPLLFLKPNFPKNDQSWVQQDQDPVWWVQFNFGNKFLYNSNNDPDKILVYSRTAMILLFLFLAWFVFFWTKKLFGNKTALLSLFLVCFSPTFLAHGRLVTTDAGAALGVVLSTYFWIKFLKKPNFKNIILASVILGISLLFKFSLLLLIPFLGIITLVYVWVNKLPFLKYIGLSILIGIIALIFVIWPVYQVHVLNYPITTQVQDTKYWLNSTSIPEPILEPFFWMSSKPILRSINHYFTGIIMALSRTTGGNTTFFMGKISAQAWPTYFPLVYLIKVPLTFHILTLLALTWAMCRLIKPKKYPRIKIKKWIKRYFVETAMLIFLIIYWTTSIKSNLNIGVRHLLPVFPFTIILISRATTIWMKKPFAKIKYIIVGLLIVLQIISVISIFPNFISYFNILIKGPKHGHKYVTDSNLDWGQDLRRLKDFVEKKDIDKIYLDYFGGGSPEYYLKDKYIKWNPNQSSDELPADSWLAVSVNELQGGRAIPVKEYEQPANHYNWLSKYQPVAKIGYSIFIYHIK